jgi:hypothetical protein
MRGGGQGGYKKDVNGNTNTAQILNQNPRANGKFSIVEQNGENSNGLILALLVRTAQTMRHWEE